MCSREQNHLNTKPFRFWYWQQCEFQLQHRDVVTSENSNRKKNFIIICCFHLSLRSEFIIYLIKTRWIRFLESRDRNFGRPWIKKHFREATASCKDCKRRNTKQLRLSRFRSCGDVSIWHEPSRFEHNNFRIRKRDSPLLMKSSKRVPERAPPSWRWQKEFA